MSHHLPLIKRANCFTLSLIAGADPSEEPLLNQIVQGKRANNHHWIDHLVFYLGLHDALELDGKQMLCFLVKECCSSLSPTFKSDAKPPKQFDVASGTTC